jgi:hypothetical protein
MTESDDTRPKNLLRLLKLKQRLEDENHALGKLLNATHAKGCDNAGQTIADDTGKLVDAYPDEKLSYYENETDTINCHRVTEPNRNGEGPDLAEN